MGYEFLYSRIDFIEVNNYGNQEVTLKPGDNLVFLLFILIYNHNTSIRLLYHTQYPKRPNAKKRNGFDKKTQTPHPRNGDVHIRKFYLTY